jgi:hypothetical protein
MAMNESVMGSAMKTEADTVALSPESPGYATAAYTALSKAIIEHLENFLEVEVAQTNNQGISVSAPSTVISQGTNPSQTIGPGFGIS